MFLHGFRPTGKITADRSEHTATLLNTGKVLITGGFSSTGGLQSAELFDPATRTFSSTGSMATGHYSQTATLLPSGKVLVAGGGTATAELFDPLTETFTPTGNMTAARYGHTATLLANGEVLITGGTGNQAGGLDSLASAEVFDPGKGTFTEIANMTSTRYGHTATLLANGEVLITGGDGIKCYVVCPLASAEIFDPATMRFTAGATMTASRLFHTATLLNNGTVLIAGGIGDGTPETIALTELFNPSSRTFSPTGSLTSPRSSHTATLLGSGLVLVTGGDSGTAETYH